MCVHGCVSVHAHVPERARGCWYSFYLVLSKASHLSLCTLAKMPVSSQGVSCLRLASCSGSPRMSRRTGSGALNWGPDTQKASAYPLCHLPASLPFDFKANNLQSFLGPYFPSLSPNKTVQSLRAKFCTKCSEKYTYLGFI